MKKLLSGIVTSVLILGFSGCDSTPSKPPVKIEAKFLTSNAYAGVKVPIVEVTSVVDSVEVTDVVVNRGNCEMSAMRKSEFPRTLKYGEKATAGFSARCNLTQVDVITDQGTWSVTY